VVLEIGGSCKEIHVLIHVKTDKKNVNVLDGQTTILKKINIFDAYIILDSKPMCDQFSS
jgi:hypothetical protein